ncbi:MAG: S-adenosylmethionine synthetase [Thermococcaceae archaeon]|uniref:methionine adenosyltransferase n=1 Tax=Thermococcus bergensis TaxID=2689387 RepID=UPI001CEDB203|nr:methionine adenosyltransferase [Thermococcus bergensis]MCA6214495.1 methionine adenosyltransferase [Thermococcus bergensis]MDK2782911.1 S-adenosylmethionine synthetase [Thermococcaceae archaeon]MDK2853204.1 S-adenosylmethionine synthetase [Thermococcaceae archaeon]MDK2982759.1 S-adenosylmethionine synthetase [Thermococcaceae archaeon]
MVEKKRNIIVEELVRTPVEMQKVELVERKGIGHPDSIADGIAEAVSRALSREYIKRYGIILHHNTDQVEVVGGRAYPRFGGGEVIKPIYILLSGRAVEFVDKEMFPVHEVAIKAAKDYLRKAVRHLDVEEHVVIDSRIGQGSVDLVGVFNKVKENPIPLANDTSFGVGYAPLSETEKIVLETEKLLNSEKFKKEWPAVGEDIKVMGLRRGDEIDLTIAAAIVDSEVQNPQEYMEVKEGIYNAVRELVSQYTERKVNIYVNTADDPENDIYYITVTGTSAEAGDDGSVGRGNRVNGLITPNRHMSMEAAAGKNPVSHVGKIYNILSTLIANDIAEQIEGVQEAYVRILSQIGKPIDEPLVASIQVIPKPGYKVEQFERQAYEIADEWLANITKIQKMILEDKVNVF